MQRIGGSGQDPSSRQTQSAADASVWAALRRRAVPVRRRAVQSSLPPRIGGQFPARLCPSGSHAVLRHCNRRYHQGAGAAACLRALQYSVQHHGCDFTVLPAATLGHDRVFHQLRPDPCREFSAEPSASAAAWNPVPPLVLPLLCPILLSHRRMVCRILHRRCTTHGSLLRTVLLPVLFLRRYHSRGYPMGKVSFLTRQTHTLPLRSAPRL